MEPFMFGTLIQVCVCASVRACASVHVYVCCVYISACDEQICVSMCVCEHVCEG